MIKFKKKRIISKCTDAPLTTGRIRWQWFDGKQFNEYAPRINELIEQSFQKKEEIYKINDKIYIDFHSMIQQNMERANRERAVRRFEDENYEKRKSLNEIQKQQQIELKRKASEQLANRQKKKIQRKSTKNIDLLEFFKKIENENRLKQYRNKIDNIGKQNTQKSVSLNNATTQMSLMTQFDGVDENECICNNNQNNENENINENKLNNQYKQLKDIYENYFVEENDEWINENT